MGPLGTTEQKAGLVRVQQQNTGVYVPLPSEPHLVQITANTNAHSHGGPLSEGHFRKMEENVGGNEYLGVKNLGDSGPLLCF